jgi:exonuclease SbcD
MKFIHAADIHLGSPFQGLKNTPSDVRERVVNSTGKAMKNMVQEAIKNAVDFVCIAGDLFDNPEPDLETLNLAIDQLEVLSDANIPVFLSYGNHDYSNNKIPSAIFPENVKIFGDEVETKSLTLQDGTTVGITGFSYNKRAEINARIEEYSNKNNQFDFQIGMLHGSMDGLKSSEAHYAPFTMTQLLGKNYDYWALGHIHKRQTLNESPIVAYSGNTQGRHINESGPRGISLVTIDQQGSTAVQFLRTDVVEWVDVEMTVQKGMDLNQIIRMVIQIIEPLEAQQLKLININLLDSNVLDADILEELGNGLILSQIQKQLDQNDFWIYRISLKVNSEIQIFSELDQEFWKKAEASVFNEKKVQEKLGRLMELGFISEEYGNDFDVSVLQDQVELMLKQRNALGDERNEN